MSQVDLDALRRGERRALAKAITLVESTLGEHRAKAQELLEALLPETGNSARIGITGVPGAGKSTFIEAFGLYLIGLGKRVAVLAVDPSSPVAGGSILGDKTRMEELSRREQAYIRPSPAGGAMGGVAQKTRETMLLCEAAGYDVILVETVGVGQSEYEVAAMVDFFMALMLPNAGDDLQGIKKGIMELVDALVINKADGGNRTQAGLAQLHYRSAMGLIRHAAHWTPEVLTCSALEHEGIDQVWQLIQKFVGATREAGVFSQKRDRQARDWMHRLISDMLQQRLEENPQVRILMPDLECKVIKQQVTPYNAASQILACL